MPKAAIGAQLAQYVRERTPGPIKKTIPKSLKRRLRRLLGRSARISRGGAHTWIDRLPCTVCRSMDNVAVDQGIARLLLDAAEDAGVPIWTLPSRRGLRFATSEAPTSSLVEVLTAGVAEHNRRFPNQQLEISPRTAPSTNNLYEFDQIQFTPPERTEFLKIHSTPHCKHGRFLRERGITVEFIEERDEFLVVPMPAKGPRVFHRDLLPLASREGVRSTPLPAWPFPIDLVYAWVDSSDPIWQRNFESVIHESAASATLQSATNAARWYSREELRFSLRSVEMYAPFIRNIYVVTNGQRPQWLEEHPRVTIVDHASLYPDASVLPTFNSNHIETVLHRIPDLAEHFLYLNDDFFFSRFCTPADFFSIGGIGKVFLSARFLGRSPVLDGDRATAASHKNTRDLLEQRFGVDCSQKFQHAPYVMRRSVWYEIEEEFADALAATRKNRFRSRADVNGQFLYAHYALLTGRSYAGTIKYHYLEVADGAVCDTFARIERLGVKVFCINDSNSVAENIAENDLEVRAALNARFPLPAPWERTAGSHAPDVLETLSQVDIDDRTTLEQEVRQLGVDGAERAYLDVIAITGSDETLRKLYKLYLNTGRTDDAIDLISRSRWTNDQKLIARVDVESMSGRSLEQIAGHLNGVSPRLRTKMVTKLVRCIVTPDDLATFTGLADVTGTADADDPKFLQLLGRATRRAGLPSQALRHFERALTEASFPVVPAADRRRGAQRMSKPFVVLRDLYEIAGPDADLLCLDAGTLLGYVRERDFIGHDYDIDLSIRDRDAFRRIADRMAADWRFSVARIRTPDLLIQAQHVDGTNVDIFLHVKEGEKWVKRSHVFGWRFDDYDVEPAQYRDQLVNVPVPTVPYLEEMYGPEWRNPDAAFDSRLYAPNCFFPDRNEIICTLLDKALQAIFVGDRKDLDKQREFLASHLDYELSWGGRSDG